MSITLNEILEDEKEIAWLDGFGILVAVFVVVIVTTTNDYRKEQQFLKLNKTAEAEKRVMADHLLF